MLILSRKPHESVAVGGVSNFAHLLKITVLEVKRGCVRLGFEVSSEVPVHRWEIWERIQNGSAREADSATENGLVTR